MAKLQINCHWDVFLKVQVVKFKVQVKIDSEDDNKPLLELIVVQIQYYHIA